MMAIPTSAPLLAVDPPHDLGRGIDCSDCHTPHGGFGLGLSIAETNANVCMSCHTPGGLAGALPFSSADQALPGVSGTSHRFDAGRSGHARPDAANVSVGTLRSDGAFTGRIERTYDLVITVSGDVGGAGLSWTDSAGNGATVTTAAEVPLSDGVTARFEDAAASPSFVAGDRWTIFVRTDLVDPALGVTFERPMAQRLQDGKVVCSTCHNQHSQRKTPVDPAAPPFGGPGTGDGRHFMRVDNDLDQMCLVCHAPRNVQSADQGSHPVGIAVPASAGFQPPANLDLVSGNVSCSTCHEVHFSDSGGFGAGSGDGYLLAGSMVGLCDECHTLGDRAQAAHLRTDIGALWPGGQYGSTLPAHPTAYRGSCASCHWPHGWPDDADPANDFRRLWTERYDLADDGSDPDDAEDLCFTCHDGAPEANLRAQFAKMSFHPVADSQQAAGRSVECRDCHDPHLARPRVDLPGPSLVPRPASGPLFGVAGVDVNGVAVQPATFEYELCFRCHGDTNAGAAPTPRQFPSTNVRAEFSGSFPSYHPVTTTGTNPDVLSLRNGWTTASIMACTDCHNNDAGPGDGGSEPNGPHGSAEPHLLERRYVTADGTNFQAANFRLCNQCHDYTNSIRRDQTFGEHKKHIENEDAPCNVCHDPHASSGNPKLINFDTSVVQPNNGIIEFQSTGPFRGTCTLTCHGEDHDGFDYVGGGPGG